MTSSRRGFLLGSAAAVAVSSVPMAGLTEIATEVQAPRRALRDALVYWIGPDKFYIWDGTNLRTVET